MPNLIKMLIAVPLSVVGAEISVLCRCGTLVSDSKGSLCECTSVIRPVSNQGFEIRDSVFRLSQLYWTWFSALVPVWGVSFCVLCRSDMGTFLTGRSGHFSVPEESQLPRGLAYQPTFRVLFTRPHFFLPSVSVRLYVLTPK